MTLSISYQHPDFRRKFLDVERLERSGLVFQLAYKPAITVKDDSILTINIKKKHLYSTKSKQIKPGACVPASVASIISPVLLVEPPGLCAMSTWKVGHVLRHSEKLP